MQGVHSLQDLKTRLNNLGFEIIESLGWYVDTIHGRWTMSFGEIYLNGNIIKSIDDAPVPNKKLKKLVAVEKSLKKAKKKRGN
jgi:hypothetical protein